MQVYTRDWTREERKHNSEFGCMRTLQIHSNIQSVSMSLVELHLVNYLHYIMQHKTVA